MCACMRVCAELRACTRCPRLVPPCRTCCRSAFSLPPPPRQRANSLDCLPPCVFISRLCFRGENAAGQLGYGDENARGDEPGEMGAALPPVPITF